MTVRLSFGVAAELKMTLLVVEDDEAVRELIVTTLTGAGYAVTTAKDGVDALDMLRTSTPEGILLDINMPRMDGFSLLQHLQRNAETRDLPVLMLTAQTDPEDIRRGVLLGARDFIGKPFQPRQLLRRVGKMLGA